MLLPKWGRAGWLHYCILRLIGLVCSSTKKQCKGHRWSHQNHLNHHHKWNIVTNGIFFIVLPIFTQSHQIWLFSCILKSFSTCSPKPIQAMRDIMSPFRSHSDNHHNHNGEVAFSRLIGQMFSIEEQSNNARWSTKAPSKRTTKICSASIFLEIVFFFRHEQKNKHSFSCISGIYPCLNLLALFTEQ